jgi:hypothetical protein
VGTGVETNVPLTQGRISMIRRFLLADDGEWVVFNVSPGISDMVDPEFCRGWLCFEHEDERRRLAPIPKNWEELPEPYLAGLWAVATPVPGIPPHAPQSHPTHTAGGVVRP